jgi:hypothetical protein
MLCEAWRVRFLGCTLGPPVLTVYGLDRMVGTLHDYLPVNLLS